MPLSLTRQAAQQSDDVRQTEEELVPRRVVTLHLRPATAENEEDRMRRVSWERNVRENKNQRVSKSCCVFHKKKLFGESSSDESSSSSSSSSSGDESGGVIGDNDQQRGGDAHHYGRHGSHEGDPAACQHGDNRHHRHKHPPCTKEHCYCGTRFH
ncbi:hypothetical protein C3747_15g194 [Trypanosoma cruzi]|uniref:Protein phosphatase inhibitor n=2 Tax=Trypanosoma cruzi TaxID=5693 RepID=Q4CTT3_TRYCC|nr:hypothetical protein, conserved [Trypanosoma cruzi]EAN83686.1 hypothetical protein, conserved [Trypanosoma cruzi]PWV18043.1 hypothetical protein C3747_15g194 [Trypanosoma cruzi]|eukprot:XP_805537.1 hypothetical protein [Trypanosoma cruzi strain CL Brener]